MVSAHAGPLRSSRHWVTSVDDAATVMYESGWTDGLPVVAPTPERVLAFLDHLGLDPDHVVIELEERNVAISAEKVAINAVMAGCVAEHLPVVVAILEAMADARFRFNHLASMVSPWPLVVVNGPITREIDLNSGTYLFGPGNRANLCISRAVSLVLSNCAGARNDSAPRGEWGNPLRMSGCIAENESTSWVPLHVQRGFDSSESVVTVVSSYPGCPTPLPVNLKGERPTRLLDAVARGIASWGGALWTRGMYTILIGPHMVDMFVAAGWSKDDVRQYVKDNAVATVADLKKRGAWCKRMGGEITEEMMALGPGDESVVLRLFADNPGYDRYLFWESALEATEPRDLDVMVVVAGGDAGEHMMFAAPYQVATNAVSRKIRARPEPG